MVDAVFDKEGVITNLEDLTVDEVATAYRAKNKEIYEAALTDREKAKIAKEEAEKVKKDLEDERQKAVKDAANAPKPDLSALEDRIANAELRSRGLSDEEIDEAKSIAKGKGINFTDALKTKTFLLFQADLKEEQRKERAKLGPSDGSNPSSEAPLVTPGMSREEHVKAWKQKLGR